MFELFFGGFIIMVMRIMDVTIGTFRTILVVQGKKYYAAIAGFVEVLIWIFAMRYIVQHMDNTINLIGYATGFAIGNILGITLEQKVGLGHLQLSVISLKFGAEITEALRKSKFGVTLVPATGNSGNLQILIIVIRRKDQRAIVKLIESIDKHAFITIQPSIPYRGFIHGSRK